MKASSNRTPCPSCGRKKTNHCRWDDSRIFCHQGVSHHPPADLRRGEVVTMDGVKYFFAGYNKGYAGNSALFCLHDPRNDYNSRPVSLADRRRQTAQNLGELEQLREDLHQAHIVASHAIAAPDYHQLLPDEIRGWLDVIDDALKRLLELRPRVMKLRHMDGNLKVVLDSLSDQIKQISYQQRDFKQFWHGELLDPGEGNGKALADELEEDHAALCPGW